MILLICRLENLDVPFFERKVGHNVEHNVGQPLERMVNRCLSDRLFQRVVQHAVRHVVQNVGRIVEQTLGRSFGRSFDRSLARNIGQTLVRVVIDRPANGKLGAQYRDGGRADGVSNGTDRRRSAAQMDRLRMRLIRFGDRDCLGMSEATRTRGGPSVSGSMSAHLHDLAGREIVGIRNWVLGEEQGIGFRQ